MITRLIGVVIYCKKLPHINSHDPLIRWSWKVILQFKYIGSPPEEDP